MGCCESMTQQKQLLNCSQVSCVERYSRFFPQIAIAIGVLTSNRGGGRRTTLTDWTWHQGAIAGSEDAVPLLCHRRVPL